MKERRKVDIMYVDETRLKRSKARSTGGRFTQVINVLALINPFLFTKHFIQSAQALFKNVFSK